MEILYLRLLRPTEGRLAAMALMLPGVGLFGAITATTTSYLMSRDGQHGAEPTLADELERLAALHSAGAFTDEGFTWRGGLPSVMLGCPQTNPLESPQDNPLDSTATRRYTTILSVARTEPGSSSGS